MKTLRHQAMNSENPSLAEVERWLPILYPGGVQCTERLITKEWALISALNGGEIPASHRLIQEEPITVHPEAWNSEIYEACLKTQNYDKGLDRFVRRFDPNLPAEAIVAIVKGVHHEHGAAVLFTQENRRCLLLDTLHGLTDDEALWYTLHSWAKFQPRLKCPRREPGQLYYPAVYSHVFEKYWATLEQPLAHPGPVDESMNKHLRGRAPQGSVSTVRVPPPLGGSVARGAALRSHLHPALDKVMMGPR
jgi:hypothetical protein